MDKLSTNTTTVPKTKVKTSTPNKAQTNILNFSTLSNISIIHSNNGQQSACTTRNNKIPPRKSTFCGNNNVAPSKFQKPSAKFETNKNTKKNVKTLNNDDDEDEDDISIAEYNNLLKGALLNRMSRRSNTRARDAMDENLLTLQKRISDTEEILRQTKENIQKINKNRDIEYLINLHKQDFKNISDVLKRKENDNTTLDKNEAVAKELEKMRNKIACENITASDSLPSIEALNKTIKETLSAYEKLSKESCKFVDENKEMSDLLNTYQRNHKKIDKAQESCSKIMPSLNSLVLEEGSYKICDNDNTSID